MKIFPILSALLLPASLSPAQEEQPQSSIMNAPADKESAKQYLVETGVEILEMLESVYDQASADAAAARMAESEPLMTETHRRFGIADEELRQDYEARGMTETRALSIIAELEENRCYGSQQLADVLGYSSEDDTAPVSTDPLPEAIQQQLAQALQQVAARYPSSISGGPGLSKETAWVLTDKAPHSITQEFYQAIPGASSRLVQISGVKDENYVCHYCSVTIDGEIYFPELWFRLPVSTPEAYYPTDPLEEEPYVPTAEAEALQEEMADNMVQMLSLLEGITDKASADAAAPRIKPIMVHLNEMSRDFQPSETALYALCAEKGYPPSRIYGIHEVLGKKRFYGSFKLANAVGTSPLVVMDPLELTPEIKAVAEPHLRKLVEQTGHPISGGPGFCKEESWVVAEADKPFDIFDMRLDFNTLPEDTFYFFSMGKESADDSRTYEYVNLFFLHEEKLYEINIWFDTTACNENAEE